MTETVAYETIAEAKGKLRLYLNDPKILGNDGEDEMTLRSFTIPIEIEGKMVVAKTKDGKFHWFFTHDNPDFIPVFVDLESSKLQKIS